LRKNLRELKKYWRQIDVYKDLLNRADISNVSKTAIHKRLVMTAFKVDIILKAESGLTNKKSFFSDKNNFM